MALLFIEGAEHEGDGVSMAAKWESSDATGYNLPTTARKRTGTYSLQIGSGRLCSKALPVSGATAIVGFAFYQTNATQTAELLDICEGNPFSGGIIHFVLGMASGNFLQAKVGSTVLQTAGTPLAANSWYYIEVKVTIHDTTGSYDVRVDGASVLSGTNVDTRNGGTGVWNRIQLATNSFASDRFYDDLYVCDGSGSLNNNFLGACRVENLMAQTGNGSNVGLTPSTGTDHGALVDEVPPNTTDYNSSPTVGAKDTYNLPSLTLSGAILGVQTSLFVAKTDAGARTVCTVCRVGGTDYDGANYTPLTTFGYLTEMRQVSPATGIAWTSAEIDGLEVGMKVTA